MVKMIASACVVGGLLLLPPGAVAQPEEDPKASQPEENPKATEPREDPRFFVNVNGLFQSGSQNLRQNALFSLYGEEGSYSIAQRVTGGSVFDISAAYRIRRTVPRNLLRGNLAVGIGYTAFTDRFGAHAEGTVPHPLFIDRFRAFQVDVNGLRHRERGVHLQAIWRRPVTNEWDVSVAVGPSLFSVRQSQISEIGFSEAGPPFSAVNVSHRVISRSRSSMGFNIGVDSTYMVTRYFGAGLTLRYAGGSVRLPTSDGGRVRVDAGGFQMGAGFRVRY